MTSERAVTVAPNDEGFVHVRPWRSPAGLRAVLRRWDEDERMRSRLVHAMRIPARAGRRVPLPADLPAPIRGALLRRGVEQLYAHQVEARSLLRAGRHTVVCTPTASGKSLCYQLPVLEALAEDPSARALFVFPTKALARDQEASLRATMHDAGLPHGAVTYDGDTPNDARRAARDRAAVIVTNPDMLHAAILPHHTAWARLLSGLRYVVVDELHGYRGVFGSHLANVLRRLRRIAAFHGSTPTFAFASATIGNPSDHASRLLGAPVRAVTESGAPHGELHVRIVQPDLVDADLGIRESYLKLSVRLAADLVREGVPTLLFGNGRNTVEVMLKYLRDRLLREGLPAEAVQAYRGGYLPAERRRIEEELRAARVQCVVATSALELGIDVGELQAVVCAGYPGSLAALWQRFGRAGRRGHPALAVLVPSSAPLDQFLAAEPTLLRAAGIEQARIDPDNPEILLQHLECAAFELPFEQGEPFGTVPADVAAEALDWLAQDGRLQATENPSGRRSWHFVGESQPAHRVSLRSVGWDNFVIVDVTQDRVIGEMDWRSVHTMLHEEAIYQHGGAQYQVERLDYEHYKAFVRPVRPDYYTTARTHRSLEPLELEARSEFARLSVGFGEVRLTERTVGFKKIRFQTHENVGYGDVDLPEVQMHTTACWLRVPESILESLPWSRPALLDALRGWMAALHASAAVGLMVDGRDVGTVLGGRDGPGEPLRAETGASPRFEPTLFFYDQVPGGVGLAERLFEDRARWARRAARRILRCRCRDGCPACFGPPVGVHTEPLVGRRRRVLLDLLEALGVDDGGLAS